MREVRGQKRARIALGVVFVVRTTALANLLPIPLAHVRGPLLGWPEPGWHFAWGGVVLPDGVRMAACIVRTLAAVLFLFGVKPRITGIMAGLLGLVALSQDPFGFIFTLYTLFLGTIVLALAEGSEVRLLHLFLASIYAWSAIAKMQSEWLSGGTLLALAEDGLLSPHVAPLLLHHPAWRLAAAYGTFAIELILPAILLIPRTRMLALAVAVGLHVIFELTAHPDVMGWVMGALLLSLLPPFQGAHVRGGVS